MLTSSNLLRSHTSSSYHLPRKLKRVSATKYELASDGLVSSAIILCGQKTLCDSIKIGYQEKIYLTDSKANGFLNLADTKQKWDRLWCRIDGFAMHFWKYPQDENDTVSNDFLFDFIQFLISCSLSSLCRSILFSNPQFLHSILISAIFARSHCLLIVKFVQDQEHLRLMWCMLWTQRSETLAGVFSHTLYQPKTNWIWSFGWVKFRKFLISSKNGIFKII